MIILKSSQELTSATAGRSPCRGGRPRGHTRRSPRACPMPVVSRPAGRVSGGGLAARQEGIDERAQVHVVAGDCPWLDFHDLPGARLAAGGVDAI